MSLTASRDNPSLPAPSLETEYGELRAMLLGAVRRRCPRWLGDQAEDIVQEVMVSVMELQQREAGERELAPEYFRRAAYNRLIDEIRRRRRYRELPLETEDQETPLPAAAPGPERTLSAKTIGQAVLDCLGRMHQARRMAVSLYLRGHAAKESASLMDWSVRRVQNLVFRGLRDLRQCLEEKGVEA